MSKMSTCLSVDALRQVWHGGAAMNGSDIQFSFTRAALSTALAVCWVAPGSIFRPNRAVGRMLSRLLLPLLLVLGPAGRCFCQQLTAPEVDGYNVHAGTQTFSPRYQFTTNTSLVETAAAIGGMGSDVVKFYLGRGMSGQYGISLPGSITDLTRLARDQASVRRVFDMPFRHYVLWTYAFSVAGDTWWKSGFSAAEGQKEYAEIYALTRYFLTNYNQSGKSFYLGHWEGDWYLLNNYDTTGNPSPTAIQGMIDWLNTRQKAVDDAMRDTPHTNVFVYAYTEANRVRDAMLNGPKNNVRLVNAVLPGVTNLDFVSWSSYDGMNLPASDLEATLNYLQSHLSTNKASRIPGHRVMIGEYGWGAGDQEPASRAYVQRLLAWGPRFILFWQIYNNEPNAAFWLIDSNNVQTSCYLFHQRFISQARLQTARFLESKGRLPDDSEFGAFMSPLLGQPLTAPSRLTVSNRELRTLSMDSATLEGSLLQGLYGDDCARVSVFWGRVDGGTNRSAWEQSRALGVNTRFNAAIFSTLVTNLASRTNYYFRFYATNSGGEAWAPASASFSTDVLRASEYGFRMKITFAGYDRVGELLQFPALVTLGPQIPGFSYSQVASRTGGDLRFTDFTGAALIPHEIDEWNTNGSSPVWVRVPRLSGTNDCIWAFWGNPLATNPPAYCTNGSTWSPGAALTWHLKESSLPFADSAAKSPAISGDPPASTLLGLVGRAGLFNGTSDSLATGTLNLGDLFTVSAWVKPDPAGNSIQTLWANKAGGSTTDGMALFINSYNTKDRKLILETGNGTLGTIAATDTLVVNTGRWCHVAAVVDRQAGSAALYVDGTNRATSTGIRNDFANLAPINLGRFPGGSPYFYKGLIDEARIETQARSADWIWAAWMSSGSNAAFQSLSSVTNQPITLRPAILPGLCSIAWPAPGVGWRLYTSTNPADPSAWTQATNIPTLANDQWQIRVPLDSRLPCFYRIRSP